MRRGPLALMALAGSLVLSSCGPSEEQKREEAFQRDLAALHSSGRRERMEAARNLGARGDKRATLEMIEALAREEDPEVREEMIRALGDLRDERATPVLVALLLHEDPEVERVAIVALGKIGDKRAVPHLIDRLARGVRWIRSVAAGALHQITGHDEPADWLDEFAVRDGVRRWERWWKDHRAEVSALVEVPRGPPAPGGEIEPWWKTVDREGGETRRPPWSTPPDRPRPPPPER